MTLCKFKDKLKRGNKKQKPHNFLHQTKTKEDQHFVPEKKDFFNTMQEWHISKIVTSINTKKVAEKKRGKEREINLGKYIVSVSWRRSSYEDKLPAFKNWLKNRAIAVTGRTDVSSISIIQYRKDFIVSTRTFSEKSLDKSVTYRFDGTQE